MFFYLLLIQSLKIISAVTTITDIHLLNECINKHTKGNALSVYINSEEVEKLGFNNCNFLCNGENLVVGSFITENDLVIDAGAHVGGWSKSVLEATNFDCTIYAFEPVPNTYKILEEQNKKQYENKVFCFNIALGKEEAELDINYFFQRESDCSTLFNRPVLCEIPVKKIKVPVTYLDKFAYDQRITRINFLKIDTEGAEFDILVGAENLIKNNNIDVIQFEYGGTYLDAHITLFQVYNYLKSNNYLIFRIIPQGLIYIPNWNNQLENFTYSNYLALKI